MIYISDTMEIIEERIAGHPCFDERFCHTSGRIHLPVAPQCNIQCNYCHRRFAERYISSGADITCITRLSSTTSWICSPIHLHSSLMETREENRADYTPCLYSSLATPFILSCQIQHFATINPMSC
jgi:uncharacterized Zn-finger protein